MIDINKYNLPFEYRFNDLVIKNEIVKSILAGVIDYEFANSLVNETVKIVDDAVMKAGYGK